RVPPRLTELRAPKCPHYFLRILTRLLVASPTLPPDSTPPAYHTEELEDFDTSGARSTSSDSTAPLSPDHPLTHTSPTPIPTYASFHRRIACMTVGAQPVMSHGHFARVAEARTFSDSALRKSEEDEIGEEDTDEDEGHGLDDEVQRVESVRLGLEGEEDVVPESQQRAALVVKTAVGQGSGCVPKLERPKRVSVHRDVRELSTGSGVVKDDIFLQRYMFRSLELE
nr:hypothetical protein [Tanacetum cinerariifolium]